MRIGLLFFCFSLILQTLVGQKLGINNDPNQKHIGEMPYEMEGREEDRIHLVDFDDCTKWKVTSKNCDVQLFRTQEERVYREYSGKIIYKTLDKNAEFTVELLSPLDLKEPWDCINFWNYADHWLWGEPHWRTAMNLFVMIQDGEGEIHEINMIQAGYNNLNHKYWFLNHMKLKYQILGPSKFVGFKFKSKNSDVGNKHILFLESVYVYKEELKPVAYKELPKEMPFPLRKETILPINKLKKYKNDLFEKNNKYLFSYSANDGEIAYRLNPKSFLEELTVQYNDNEEVSIANNSEVIIDSEEEIHWEILNQKIERDTLFINYLAKNNAIRQEFATWYTIKQKSLICGINEMGETGLVSEIKLGTTEVDDDAKLTVIPMLNFNNSNRPAILYSNDLFHFTMFDWYYSNASSFTGGFKNIEDGEARYNGGVKYIPLINGKRNLLREKLFINISPDVQEVFPTIDNPSSPMRDSQSDRLWVINGGSDIKVLGDFVTDLRSKGVEKVSIRYHEGFWREGGESYTFKLNPNPLLSDEKIRDYVSWVKSNDWRVGLYSNYTDYAPVNSNWNEDWVKRGPNGEWEVSWSRCYSPKPQIAWEQESIFAPKIQRKFGTNHSYCDVHTAVSPMTRVDYDYRVPGAGTFRHVINCYGLLLMNESRSYQGPVYSEGGNHWWYSGLLDGNYANGHLDKLPVFPDFHLMQIHPKEMDAAHTGEDNEYFAYALAYGNIGLLTTGIDAVKKYAFIQPLQHKYSMIPVQNIEYFDKGKSYSSSDAIKKDLIKKPQLHVKYESGFQVYTNFSEDNWEVMVDNTNYTLPKFGVLAFQPNSNLMSFSGINEESLSRTRIDRTVSSDLCFIDTFGEQVESGKIRGKGSYILKKEKFGWEIIALNDLSIVDFDRSLINSSGKRLMIQPVDMHGNNVENKPFIFDAEKIKFNHHEGVYKYKIIPIR